MEEDEHLWWKMERRKRKAKRRVKTAGERTQGPVKNSQGGDPQTSPNKKTAMVRTQGLPKKTARVRTQAPLKVEAIGFKDGEFEERERKRREEEKKRGRT